MSLYEDETGYKLIIIIILSMLVTAENKFNYFVDRLWK